MNVFQTHSKIVSDYETYIRSFLRIADPAIRGVVEGELSQGKLWPEPLLQFNPAYQKFGSLDELTAQKILHPTIRDIFKGFTLYRHQVEAIKLGTAGKDFIVTSGTGSGKSLTYIGSIFHHLLSHPGEQGVTAVVVYPMNALINSQYDEFTRYKENYENSTGKQFPISFGQYTGQTMLRNSRRIPSRFVWRIRSRSKQESRSWCVANRVGSARSSRSLRTHPTSRQKSAAAFLRLYCNGSLRRRVRLEMASRCP